VNGCLIPKPRYFSSDKSGNIIEEVTSSAMVIIRQQEGFPLIYCSVENLNLYLLAIGINGSLSPFSESAVWRVVA